MLAVEALEVSKVYEGRVKALDGASFNAPYRAVTCLLGRNGAGKTTFIKIAATLLLPTSGVVRILGLDVVAEQWKVKERIGLMPQEGRPLDFPTPEELVTTYLVMRGYSFSEAKKAAREALELLELWEWRKTPIYKLSGGMRQKVLLAMALATDAEVLFLDEPTLGLDPHSRRSIWASIGALKRRGHSILLTTHYMEEAEYLGDKVVIIEQGRIAAEGTPQELISKVGASHRVDVEDGFTLEELKSYGQVYRFGVMHAVYTSGRGAEELAAEAVRRGARAKVAKVSLEDAFIVLTGGVRIEEQ